MKLQCGWRKRVSLFGTATEDERRHSRRYFWTIKYSRIVPDLTNNFFCPAVTVSDSESSSSPMAKQGFSLFYPIVVNRIPLNPCHPRFVVENKVIWMSKLLLFYFGFGFFVSRVKCYRGRRFIYVPICRDSMWPSYHGQLISRLCSLSQFTDSLLTHLVSVIVGGVGGWGVSNKFRHLQFATSFNTTSSVLFTRTDVHYYAGSRNLRDIIYSHHNHHHLLGGVQGGRGASELERSACVETLWPALEFNYCWRWSGEW